MQALDIFDPFQDRSDPFNDCVDLPNWLCTQRNQLDAYYDLDPLLLLPPNYFCNSMNQLNHLYLRPYCDTEDVGDGVVIIHDVKWAYALSEVGS